MPERVRVAGLKEFQKSLRALDSDLPKAVRLSLNAAVDIVLDYARPRIPSRSGRAARSLRAASTQTTARVSAGGRRAPYYPWLDFGGRVGAQRQIRRPFYREGRYLYKGLAVKRTEFTEAMERSVAEVARRAGFDVGS